MFEMFKGSYSQIQSLITWIEICQFVLKHTNHESLKYDHVYLGISDALILMLEDECERFEKIIEPGNQE